SRTRRTPSPFSRFSRRSTCSRSSRSRVSYNTSRPMPAPGDTQAPDLAGPPSAGPRSAAELLQDAREQAGGGRFAQAMVCYEAAIATAEGGGELAVLAEALRRLAILRQQRDESTQARELCDRSYDVARAIGDDGLAAEALNTLGGLHLTTGSPVEARHAFVRALELGGSRRDLNARVHQNLGILANIQGDLEEPRFEGARQDGEASLALFDRLGARGPKADAYRVIGTVYRETGRPALAESRLRAAMDLAATTGSVLGEAEASRELALLYQSMGRNQEALTFLNRAYRLFRRLDARVDLVHVGGKVAELEGAYRAVVREWGRSIESADASTFTHCERVARSAVAVARELGLDDQAETTILLGAYLHDVGKVRVPHELLHKPGPLSAPEIEVMQMHPVWGVELLAG